MSYVTYDRVTSHMNEWCHAWLSRVIYKSVMSRLQFLPQLAAVTFIWQDIRYFICVTWVMSHMTESRHTYNSLTKVAMVTSLFQSIRYFTCISATWVMSDQNVSYHTYNNLAHLVIVKFICVLGTSYMWHEACHNWTSHVTRTTISRNSFPSRSSVY